MADADFGIRGEATLDTSSAEKSATGLSDKLGDALDKSGQKMSLFASLGKKAADGLTVAIGNFETKIAQAAVQAVQQVVSTGLEFNRQMENYQLAFENLLGSAEAANAALDAIKADAASTPFDVAGLVSANRLLISTGQSAEEARQVINALGNAVSASGGGNAELERMAANLQQIANVGKASAVDVRQFAYAGIDIYGILADYTGMAKDEVQGLTVSYDLLVDALKAASAEGGRYAGAMEAYSQTLQGRMDTLADNATQLAGAITETLFDAQKDFVEAASGWVDTLAETLEAEGPGAMMAAGVQIVFEMINGVVSAAPQVVEGAAQTIKNFVLGLLNNLPAIAASAGEIVSRLVIGLIDSTAQLTMAAADLVAALVDYILSFDWVDVGVQLVLGLGRGLVEGLPHLAQTVIGWAQNLAASLEGIFNRITSGEVLEDAANAIADAGETAIENARNPYHIGSVKDENYWKQVGKHFRDTGQVQTSTPNTPTYDFDFGSLGSAAGTAAKQVETLADKLEKAGKALSESQSAYKTLSAAVEEYNEAGSISLATWQDLMDLAPAYQALLVQEGDKLAINQAAYNELTAAQRLEIETLAQANGVLPETIQLIDGLGIAAEEAADKTGTAFSELKEKLDGLTKDGPLAVIADLAGALKDGDWSGAAQAVAEGLWLTITPDQQDAISGWAVQAVQSMTDGFTSDGWAGLINAGATIVQGLAEGITSGQGVFVEAAQGLISTFSGLGESVMPAVGNAVMSLLGALNTLVPGIDLASAATAVFNAILDANPIILVISLIGMLASALYGFAQTNTKVGETIRNIWDGIVNAVRSALQFVLGMIEGVFEAAFAAWNLFVKVAGKYLGLKEIHFDFTSWLDPKEDNDEALEENTEAIKENTELIRNPPRYQSGGSGPTGGVTDYSAMLAAARAEVLAQNTRVVSNYDAGSGQTAARLNASWHGTSTTVLELDGREVARAVTPYVDEDLAF